MHAAIKTWPRDRSSETVNMVSLPFLSSSYRMMLLSQKFPVAPANCDDVPVDGMKVKGQAGVDSKRSKELGELNASGR